MPRPKGALDLYEFQRGHIIGQHEGGLHINKKYQKNSQSHFLL